MSETRLVRSGRDGATIHLSGCHQAKGRTYPWKWAEGRDDYEWVVMARFKPCRTCLPALATLQHELRAKAGV